MTDLRTTAGVLEWARYQRFVAGVDDSDTATAERVAKAMRLLEAWEKGEELEEHGCYNYGHVAVARCRAALTESEET